jgi:hypothetical protein
MENHLATINWPNMGYDIFVLSIPVLFVSLSIPFFFDKIPPNRWYGFRTHETLSNKEIWYKANRYMARDLLVLGIVHLVFTVFMVLFAEINGGPPADQHAGTWCFGYAAILGVGSIIMVVRSLLYLKKL